MNKQKSIMKKGREKSFQGLKMRSKNSIKKGNMLDSAMKGK